MSEVAYKINQGEKPLVTFVLFAYNQEQFIREAVLGALAQTYEPLEIILSDDCSQDRTFEIMKELAEFYDGPHKVIIRKSTLNSGLINHINSVVSIISGDYVVLAAGDDISSPKRTAIIVDAFINLPEAKAVCSTYKVIGSDQDNINRLSNFSNVTRITIFNNLVNAGGVGAGATYAYDAKCFVWPSKIPETILSEDRILPFRASILGNCYFIDSELVSYRISPGSLTSSLRSKKLYAHNRNIHWKEIRVTLDNAIKSKKILRITYIFLLVISYYVEFIGKFNKIKINYFKFFAGWIFKFPLRLIRKMQRKNIFQIYHD